MSAPAAVELLSALAWALAARGLRWYLFGAQAVVVHGRPRLSEDVDVTVDLGDVGPAAFVDELASAGFDLAVPADDDFVAQTRVLPFVHRSTGMPLDVVLAGPGLEQLFLEQAQLVDIGGLEVPVIRPEHLVVVKVLAARPKDLDDARGILAEQRSRLDVAQVRHLLGELEQALGQSDLTPTFESLFDEVSL